MAAAAVFSGGAAVFLLKGLEDLSEHLFRHTAAGICNDHCQDSLISAVGLMLSDVKRDLSACGSEFDGI